ncbi:hypothetical protein ACFWG4_00255 [Rhodococcus wratislaviensis]|uniref:hypothetical protein n=1 Tax=Rhodococcus wratislaviensis TaxID=44752 RepID=UPI00365DA68B
MIAHAPIDTQYGAVRSRGRSGYSIIRAATATDWAATTQMNQAPLARATTGRSEVPRTAVHGTT